MKLKNLLFSAFLFLTFIPTVIVTVLLYNSGMQLSKESYIKNITESITVQSDYISETLKDNMLNEHRFAMKTITYSSNSSSQTLNEALYDSFQAYLEISQDTFTLSVLLDETDTPVYTIGEEHDISIIQDQLSSLSSIEKQTIVEFHLGDETYSLGIVTPIYQNETYRGCLISIYNKTYMYKIISSYYEISDSTTYICRGDGSVVNFKGSSSEKSFTHSIENTMQNITLASEGILNFKDDNKAYSGYYKNIHNTPWYLTGLVDDSQVYAFANQFIWIYIVIIACIILADIIFSFYISQRVVALINLLIKVMDDYPNSIESDNINKMKNHGYVETRYLWSRFISLMEKILLVQHNFEGVYQLYHSSSMDDINIDIDVKKQTIQSNKEVFNSLMKKLEVPEGACVVERFTRCFCDKDQQQLMLMLIQMRDKHLSVTEENDVYTPYLGGKWFHSLIVPMYEDERLSRLFIQLRDVSSFKKQELASKEQAKRDPLTSLYNRIGFIDNVSLILSTGNMQAVHGLFFIDMNNFKLVNDTFGHKTGDDLLYSVSKQLNELCCKDCIISRFGGDEFAIFMPNTSEKEVKETAALLTQTLVYSYHSDKDAIHISASVGYSVHDSGSPCEIEVLLEQADTDMYKKKREMKKQM